MTSENPSAIVASSVTDAGADPGADQPVEPIEGRGDDHHDDQQEQPLVPSHEDQPSTDGEPETFPRAYVEQLRDENARYRTRAARADEAHQRLLETTIRSAAADHLADPGDLLTFAEADDLTDDDGWPDADRIVTAAKALAQTKPHLAPRRPKGDIGQGMKPFTDPMNLAAILKARAS